MKLVVDANILFAALIKDSLTAELLFKEGLALFSPEFVIEEFMKYELLLLEKTSRSHVGYVQIMHMLKDIISVIPKGEYFGFMEEAKKISPDLDDIPYFALALKLNCAIWSNEKKLKEQSKIKIYSTKDLAEMLQHLT